MDHPHTHKKKSQDTYTICANYPDDINQVPGFQSHRWELNASGRSAKCSATFTLTEARDDKKSLILAAVELAARACGARRVVVGDGPWHCPVQNGERILLASRGYVWQPIPEKAPNLLPVGTDGYWVKNF